MYWKVSFLKVFQGRDQEWKLLLLDGFFPSFLLTEGSPRDLQKTAYKQEPMNRSMQLNYIPVTAFS